MYDSELIGRFHKAVLSAYNTQSLERMVRFKLDKKLDHYVSGDDLRDTVFDLIEAAEQEGWFEALVAAAHEEVPGNRALRASVEEINAVNAGNASIPQIPLQPLPPTPQPPDFDSEDDDGGALPQPPASSIWGQLPQWAWGALGVGGLVVLLGIARFALAPSPTPVDPTPTPTATATPVAAATEPAGGADGDLVIWHAYANGNESRAVIAQVADALMESSADLTITQQRVAGDTIVSQFVEAVENGNAPDLLLGDSSWAGQLIDNDTVRDASLLISVESTSRLVINPREHLTYGGQIVGVPYTMRGILLMRNSQLLPQPLEQIEQLSDVAPLHNLERGLFYSGASLNALGGSLMDANGNPAFDSDAGVAWLELITRFNDPNSYGDQDLVAFERGEVGLVLDANWNVGRLASAIEHRNFEIDPWPAGMSGWVQYDVAFVAATVESEKIPLVKQLLDALISAETQSTFADNGQIPVVNDAVITNRLVAASQRTLATSVPFPLTPKMGAYWEPLTDAINDVYNGDISAEEALAIAKRKVEATLP